MLSMHNYSRALLIRTQDTWKICANYPSMQIIRANFTLHFCQQWRVVYRTTIRIIREVRINEGQIIRAILYAAKGIVQIARLYSSPH